MRKAVALLILLMILAGCGGARPADQPAPAEKVDDRVAAASSRFGIDLLKQVYKGENAFLSPTSASLVLSLTAAGAGGETQAQMTRTLGFREISMSEIHKANGQLQSILTNPDPKVEVSLANAVWYRTGLKVAPAFADTAKQHYGAAIDSAEFGDPSAVKKINDWTAKATKQKIKELLASTTPSDVMILVNALYFKGEWTHAFDPKLTREGAFTKLDSTQKQVPFMHREGEFGALEADGFRAVRLPYGKERVSMYVFVPDDLPAFVAGLTPERWEQYMQSFKPRQGLVSLPKVKLEATHKLNEPLQNLGMELAFDMGQADFSGLFEGGRSGIGIALVLQKTFLEINEQGTEAAAATAVVLRESASEPLAVADRPFLIAIRDDQTGTLLFIGTIVEP
ncbi:MAG: serpin family protein [Bacillota bacterium]